MNRAQYGCNVLSGLGQFGPVTQIVALVQFTSPRAFVSTATILGFSGRAIGGAFGPVILDAIIDGKLKSYPTTVSNAAVEAGLPKSSVPALLEALGTGIALIDVPCLTTTVLGKTVDASDWACARAYRLAWASTIPFVVLSLVGISFLKWKK